MAPVTPPEHRARTRRWGRDDEKRRGRRRRRRRTGRDAAARDARRERADAGLGGDDVEKVVPEPELESSPVKKLKWLPSQIGEVLGSLCRVESIDYVMEDEEDQVPVPDGNLDKGKEVVLALEAAPAPAPAPAVAPSSSSSRPAASSSSTVSEMFLAPITMLQAPPPPPPPHSSSSQAPAPRDKKPLLLFSVSMPAPPHAPPHHSTTLHPPPASSSRAIAPPFPLLPLPPPPPPADAFERHELLKKRFSKLISKSEKEIDERYRENLKRSRAPPTEPEPVVVEDEETLFRRAAVATTRQIFRRWMRAAEMKVKRDGALFMHNARREDVRALGIDDAMERVVSPERPRGRDGEPILSPEHPRSPVEKLGLFLKPL